MQEMACSVTPSRDALVHSWDVQDAPATHLSST